MAARTYHRRSLQRNPPIGHKRKLDPLVTRGTGSACVGSMTGLSARYGAPVVTVVLGVEGGGSHTHALVVDGSGGLVGAAATRDPSNWEDVGFEAASAAIRACVREALASSGTEPAEVAAAVFGLAGVDFPIDEDRLGGVPSAIGVHGPVQIVNDSFVALRAGTDRPFGVVAVAGTGSVVAGRNRAGRTFRTLGLGPVFGDTGSASEVSAAAFTAVADAYLGRGPQTTLTEALLERTELASVLDLLEATGRGRVDDSRFAPLVVAAARGGDAPAASILREAGRRIGLNVAHAVRTLEMQGEEFDLVLTGGMFRSESSDFVEPVLNSLGEAAPAARAQILAAPPVAGAVLLALELAGARHDAATRTQLLAEAPSALGIRVPA
jgi:N-acetylglucosamine kinase-like BadF-type ATPase